MDILDFFAEHNTLPARCYVDPGVLELEKAFLFQGAPAYLALLRCCDRKARITRSQNGITSPSWSGTGGKFSFVATSAGTEVRFSGVAPVPPE